MEQKDLELVSASSWRTDRVNVLVYGDPGAGKTDFAARFPNPVMIDTGENGQLTVKKMLAEGRLDHDIPIIRTHSFHEAMLIVQSPEAKLRTRFKGTPFENYEIKTVVIDNVTTLEEWCIEEVLKAKGKTEMEVTEINRIKNRMTNFFRAAWVLDLNTVLIAHAYDGRQEARNKQGSIIMSKKDKGPNLTGQLAKLAPAATDFFLYFTTEYQFGGGEEVVCYSTANEHGYPARTRLKGILDAKIVNPSYEHLRAALDKLEGYGAEVNGNAPVPGDPV